MSETEKSGAELSLWRLTSNFQIQVLWATFINAADNVRMKYTSFFN